MDLLGVQSDIAALKGILADQDTKILALESKAAQDVKDIVAQVIAGLRPPVLQACEAVNTLTVTVNTAVAEIVNTARRINGASITVKLGEDGQ